MPIYVPRFSLPALAFAVCGALACARAHAGAEFTATTHNDGRGLRLATPGDVVVKGRVEHDKGRLEYVQSPMLPKGSVVVTDDGARSAKLYNRKTHDCGDMPLPGAVPTGMRAQAAALNRYDDIKVDKKSDDPGPTMHGVATRHLRYAIAYTQHPAGAPRPLHGTIDLELWLAPALTDAAFDLWLGAAVHTGNEQADREIAAGMADAKGAALKRIQRTSLQVDGGAAQQSTSTLEVTRLAVRKLSAKSLAPPFVCRVGKSPD